MERDVDFYKEYYEYEIFKEFKEEEKETYLEILQEMLNSKSTDIEELEKELINEDLDINDNEYFKEAFDDFIRYDSQVVKEIEEDGKSYSSDPYSYYGVSRSDFY